MEGVPPVKLQTLQGDGGDVPTPLGRVPSTRTGKNAVVQFKNSGGRSKTPHRLILDFFEHEKIRGLMNANSELLEESDPDDPPTQSENGEGRTFPTSEKKAPLRASRHNGSQLRWKPPALYF